MSDPRWSVVVPVFNERDFLPRTLLSLAAQTVPFPVIVVDNGSTDGCTGAAQALAAEHRLDARFLHEPRDGQVHALKRGLDAADTELVAVGDADIWYPPHYLECAGRLFDAEGPGCVAVAAYNLPEREGWRRRKAAWHKLSAAWIMPRQNHTSGACHCFRLEAVRAVGGYDAALWPYVLKDHELMHRVLQLGAQAYHRDLWCVPSERRKDRSGVRWSLAERLLYHVTPFGLKTRLFREFLGPRFAARGLGDVALRQRSWG